MFDPAPHLARLKGNGARLDVGPADLCGLVLLRVREAEAIDIDEDEVIDLLARAHEQFPGVDAPGQRAANTLQRACAQRLLTRVDAAGLARKGRYALSPLGRAIVDYFVADEQLSQESLAVLAATLHATLLDARDRARAARTPGDWQAHVHARLGAAASDLLEGIRRRAGVLDEAQDRLRRHLADMLDQDWFAALDDAEVALESATRTLAELSAVLLEESARLGEVLDEIDALARAAGEPGVADLATQLGARVRDLAAWGRQRHQAWSQYFQLMLVTLRAIIRLDPGRAVSQRLRDGIRTGTLPGRLVVVEPVRTRVLREVTVAASTVLVTREHAPESAPAVVRPEPGPDIDALVREALSQGAVTLTEVLAVVLPVFPASDRYWAAGRVAARVAMVRRVSGEPDAPWTRSVAELFVTDWKLGAPR